MEKERNLNYWTIRKFSLLYSYYAIIDTTDYLADQLLSRMKSACGSVRSTFARTDPIA